MRSEARSSGRTLFVSDLDFTLLRSDATLSERTMRVVNRVLEAGHLFTCATARSFTSALRVTTGLDLTVPLIAYGGAVLFDVGSEAITEVAALPEPAVAAILDLTDRNDHIEPLLYVMLDGRDRVCWRADRTTPFIDAFASVRRGNPRLMPLKDWSIIEDATVFYANLIGSKDHVDALRAELAPHLNRCFDTVGPDGYHPDQTWFEITSREGTKAAAAARLQTQLGATRLVVFGDNLNDVPLFRSADYSCAVANAVPELRAIADQVISSNDDNGVATWLEQHVLP